MLPADLQAGYGPRESEALEAVEVAMTRVLTGSLRMTASVIMGDQIRITAYPESAEPIIISIDTIHRKLRRHLRHQVELELRKRRTLLESERLKSLRGAVASGAISHITADGTLLITLEIGRAHV